MEDDDEKIRVNDELRAELVRLNAEIDAKLRSRGVTLKGRAGKTPTLNPAYDSPVHRENEKVKRENARLLKRLRESTSLTEVQQARDMIAEKQKQIDEVRLANHTLEQVTKNQGKGLEQVTRIEGELAAIARSHNEEVARLKETLREERATRDALQQRVNANQTRLSSMKARVAAAKAPVHDRWASAEQLRDAVQAKEGVLRTLTESVEEAKRNNGADEELRMLRRDYREQTAATTKLHQCIHDVKESILEADKVLKMSASPYVWKYSER